jgi:hypothetical protein
MERVHQVYLGIPAGRFTGLPADGDIPLAAAHSMLRGPCRGLIELTAAIGWPKCAANAIAYHHVIRRLCGGSQEPGTQFT